MSQRTSTKTATSRREILIGAGVAAAGRLLALGAPGGAGPAVSGRNIPLSSARHVVWIRASAIGYRPYISGGDCVAAASCSSAMNGSRYWTG
jgi:hypothetical protein